MSTAIQLNPQIEVETPLGHGWAMIYNDDGEEVYWTVFHDDGTVFIFRNNEIRASNSYTRGRFNPGIGPRLRATKDPRHKKMQELLARLERPNPE
jgi:hypothetical protein